MSKLKVGISKNIHHGSTERAERDPRPGMVEKALIPMLEQLDCEVADVYQAELTEEEDQVYGSRMRMALASNHTADHIASMIRKDIFPIGLLSDCNQLIGMLAGHQRVNGKYNQARVGLVWMDAHGDFNTPETSLSGSADGMPVAVSTGLGLHHIRRAAGLDPPLAMRYVSMFGVRDLDPAEQYLIDKHRIHQVTVEDIKTQSSKITKEIERLASLTDYIYVHIDLDVITMEDMPGHSTPVASGPTADELATVVEMIFRHPKVTGLGLAAYPGDKDPEIIGLASTLKQVEGAIRGIKSR